MKISKKAKKVTACDETITEEALLDPQVTVEELTEVVEPIAYENACCYVKSAIECLTTVAETEPRAKELIADLSVVYLELQ